LATEPRHRRTPHNLFWASISRQTASGLTVYLSLRTKLVILLLAFSLVPRYS